MKPIAKLRDDVVKAAMRVDAKARGQDDQTRSVLRRLNKACAALAAREGKR